MSWSRRGSGDYERRSLRECAMVMLKKASHITVRMKLKQDQRRRRRTIIKINNRGNSKELIA